MNHPDYNSPAALKSFLAGAGMAVHKQFGQNFLINAKARARLVRALSLSAGMTVWEIGPGLGAMTECILKTGARLTVFEIDRGFAAALKEFFATEYTRGQLTVVTGDVLKTWHKEYARTGPPDCFFGNLPYNSAATLIASTIEHSVRFSRCVVTVQKEVAERLCAAVGTAAYSSLSILCQWAYSVRPVMDLAGGNFWPRPRVDSRAVVLTPRADFPRCKNPPLFMRLQRALFLSRRKNIRNNLTAFLGNGDAAARALTLAGIDPQLRPEAVPIETLLQLSDCLNDAIL
ncbi:MAG: ribosomal RNA small subunit methyltransferase A [Treponema sp.]|nr:ribosomal RNA small subunit methyltransferase A [Treponema sp.]